MRIDDTCIACGACIPYCPVGAISMDDVAVIDEGECVECGVCFRSGVCPVDAFVPIVPQEVDFGRALRAVFSDPTTVHAGTGVPGRGTEEMKTNEVTGRFKRGWVGMGFEFGRPGVGTRFYDVDKVARVLAKNGAQFEPKNPVTGLMEDPKTGKLREEILNEKALSAIVECVLPIEKMKDALNAFQEIAPQLDTVVSVECTNMVELDNSLPMDNVLKEMGIPRYINGKTNVGLGKPRAEGV